jgi:hypothetical protein
VTETEIPHPDPELFEGLEEVPLEAPEEADKGVRALIAESLGLRMVRAALGQRGVCETGKNGGVPLQRYVKAFWPQSGPEPWCAFFISWCYLQSTGRQPPWTNKGLVGSVYTWAKGAGVLHPRPQQGDMFGIGGQHMGMVRGVNQNGSFVTIEGNTSSGCVRGFVRPAGSAWFAGPR